MKRIFRYLSVACLLSLVLVQPAFAQTLVLSDRLRIELDAPLTLAHSERMLIMKYSDWSLMHEVVNPAEMYTQINLTGIERDYIIAMFDPQKRRHLPGWLAALADEQARILGIEKGHVNRTDAGDVSIYSVYDPERQVGHLYVFEPLKIHHLIMQGPESRLMDVIGKLGGK
ncbi:hypothetical protein AAIA72_16055 [Hahella sp. SMD15-11]|uniref:Uncharacterized protein n=1 Tax=Thermohahella caldifontis TaxID=3142973 RepID=A0AB39UWE6_9GAMM